MNWSLPDSVEIQNTVYPIRTDYRCILDILTDITDPEADGQDRAIALLIGLYPGFADMPPENYDEAIRAGMRFINCDADDAPHRAPRLVDWEQDYSLIIAPVNRAIGAEIRAMEFPCGIPGDWRLYLWAGGPDQGPPAPREDGQGGLGVVPAQPAACGFSAEIYRG